MESVIFKRSSLNNEEYRKLYKEVQNLLRLLPQERRIQKRWFALLMPVVYSGLYAGAMIASDSPVFFVLCYIGMGIVSVLMFINLIHDAVHSHVFTRKWQNQAYLILFDLMGGNSFIWKKRHLLLHHNYANIAGFDADIEQSGPIKIFPQQKGLKIHRYQHLYVFLLYPLFLFNWIFIRDFKDFFSKGQLIRRFCKIPVQEYVKLFLFKGIFFSYIIFLPILIGIPVLQVLSGLSGLLVAGSIVAMLSLLTPHANSANEFPVASGEGKLEVTWLEHQFLTTNDLNVDNWFTRNLMGNFNFHLAHHLFPQIHSAYAREVTQCIREFALKNQYPYKKFGLGTCLKLHYKLICSNSEVPNILEEDM